MMPHRIPNGLVVAIVAAFYVHALLTGMPLAQIVEHTLVGFACLILLAFMGHALGVGPGVVKLLSAGVLWFGLDTGSTFVILACVSSGLAALLWALIKQDRDVQVPMLPFAAISAFIVIQFGDVLQFVAI